MRNIITGTLFALMLTLSTVTYAKEAAKDPTAFTTENTDIVPEQLHLMVRHLTSDELFVEADGWLDLLKEAAKNVYEVKSSIEERNTEITVLQAKDNNQTKEEERGSIQEKISQLKKEKATLLEELTKLRADRKDIVDRLDTVLQNINEKIGLDENGKELDKVLPYRRYINTVSGITVEITDAQSAWETITGWLMSEEGGIYWLINILKFIAIIFVAMFVSRLLSKGARKALELSPSNSQLLNDFIANIIHKLVMLVGLLVALAALDINVAPLMAMVGAAGFVVAFALQGTLSNFASGLMIMLYRPFDIDDVIDVAGVIGTVKSMTLVTTSIMTADNRMMIIPNNTIWGSIITNVTHSDNRRVDMTFGIGYGDNIDRAQNVLEDILAKHPLILKDPEPTVQVNELADSSVNFIVRPWTLTSDYWTVYWEITRRVKIRFDEENISIPFPQQDMHIISSSDEDSSDQKKRKFTKEHAKEVDVTKMESGKEDND